MLEIGLTLAVGYLSGLASFLFCRVLTSKEMIFENWPQFVYERTQKRAIQKLLYDCPVCQGFWLAAFVLIGYGLINIYTPFGLVLALYAAYEQERKNET